MAGSLFGVPASPWTERFGTNRPNLYSLKKKKDELLHNGLAPSHPSLHPLYYDTVPPADEFAAPRNNEEIDDVLTSEEFQRTVFFGSPSWRIAPLNSVLSWDGVPEILGGHRPGDDQRYPELLQDYMAQRIEVNESTWLPFFRRNRWYNMDLDAPETIVEADGTTWQTDTWNVDDERIWNVLRFSLEIANRILTTMIRDNNRWLGVLLYGRIQMWYELNSFPEDYPNHIKNRNYAILMDPDTEKIICRQMRKTFLGRDIEPDARRRRNYLTRLLRGVIWSFMPSTEESDGVTSLNYDRETPYSICQINSNIVKLLCGGSISVAERCTLHMRQAITILHELMHAVLMGRLDDGQNVSPKVASQVRQVGIMRFEEPYIENEPIREIGRSFEAAVFGGTPVDKPFGLGGEYTPNISMLVVNVKYPSRHAVPPGEMENLNYPSLKPDAPVELSLLPVAFFWRLQSKAFWSLTPPNGEDGFLFPKLFSARTRKERYTLRDVYGSIAVDPDVANGALFQDLAQRWNHRLSVWSGMRQSWYDSALRTWLRTPWSYVRERNSIDIFCAAYKAKDEAECARIAWRLERSLPQGGFDSVGHYISNFIPETGSTTGNRPLWLFHCLSLLMLAALPLRRETFTPAQPRVEKVVLRPSETVDDGAPPGIRKRLLPKVVRPIARRDQYFSRLRNARTSIRNRDEFVTEAKAMIEYFGRVRRIHIHEAFLNALRQLAEYIRGRIRARGFRQLSWLPSFPFEMPAYEPLVLVRWNRNEAAWEDVERRVRGFPGRKG